MPIPESIKSNHLGVVRSLGDNQEYDAYSSSCNAAGSAIVIRYKDSETIKVIVAEHQFDQQYQPAGDPYCGECDRPALSTCLLH